MFKVPVPLGRRPRQHLDFLMSGLQMTLIISAITLVLAMIGGLIIALLDMSSFPPAALDRHHASARSSATRRSWCSCCGSTTCCRSCSACASSR